MINVAYLVPVLACGLVAGYLFGARTVGAERDRVGRLVRAFGQLWATVPEGKQSARVHAVFVLHAPELHDLFHELGDPLWTRGEPRAEDLQ